MILYQSGHDKMAFHHPLFNNYFMRFAKKSGNLVLDGVDYNHITVLSYCITKSQMNGFVEKSC